MKLLPDTGYTPGSPLPGSILTYTDVGGLLTVNYQLANPVTSGGDINLFRLDFKFLHPVVIDLSKSTVTYETSGPGGDFTQVGFGCTTTDGLNRCGSDFPSSGTTGYYAFVPEPAAWMMVLAGFGLVGIAVRSRRRGGLPSSTREPLGPSSARG
ncbi:MAG: PEPxxWA-CTERM sorting domain-containing protein [Caulobacteraceae bacterium]